MSVLSFNITNPGLNIAGILTSQEQQFVTDLVSLEYEKGDILYHDGTSLERLGIGSEHDVLAVSSDGIPSWVPGGGLWGGSLDSDIYSANSGSVGIGTSSPSVLLDVAGDGKFSGELTIGEYTLPDEDGTTGQVLTTDGSGAVTWQDAGEEGTVTSVAMTVPTGFSVSGTPITTSGTLAVTYASGYQGYTTAEASKLSGIATGAEVNVNADWDSVSGDSQILNKPDILDTHKLYGVSMDSSTGSPSDGKILVYRSAGSDWVLEDKPQASGNPAWGDITGTLASQTDLQSALDDKYDASNPSGYTSNTGTVTSVALSVPTGFAISGSPVTTSGTLALTYDTGYQGFTTSEAGLIATAVQDLGDLGITATAGEINVLDGITATTTELNYTDGVTSNIQTQLNNKANTSSLAAVATSGDYDDLINAPSIPTQYTDEMAQDAVGNILTDSSEVDFAYNDGTPSISASLIDGSVALSRLSSAVQSSLGLADSSLQSADIGTSVQGFDATLDAISDLSDSAGVLTNDGSGNLSWGAASGGGITWNAVTGTSQTASVDNGYITDNSSLVTVTLPSTAAVGSTVRIAGKGSGMWKLAQNSGQAIHFLGDTTTTGTSGSIAAATQYDAIEVLCITANTTWVVISSVGNLVVT